MIAMSPSFQAMISRRALARRLGRPESTVWRWLKDPRFPFDGDPPWPASITSKIAKWAVQTLDPEATGAYATMSRTCTSQGLRQQIENLDPLRRARLRKLVIETEKLKRQNQIFDSLYIDRAKARAELSAIFHNIKTALLAEARSSAEAADSLGLLVVGGKAKLAKLLVERCEALLNRFADSMKDVADSTN